ncbi:potassium/proton antiporter [Flaviaesturariibacter flavus]|uniref:Potassium/proton antiporter n=1 Tax=Flaviaesturariibacter flavus TaxID=2502780 RepID=A0A4R1BIQ3_9BACT|nr:potassium/proton antiporter [Flaviaesturariibacter flavus]TCJ17048.1 potassium/proton antiporter [Flaviaesturariibacter flavus]
MRLQPDNILLIGSILLLISVLAGKAIRRLGVPTLIFFLLVGIAAGSEGIGGIAFDNAAFAQFIGIVALNFILFSGGLDTNWRHIRPVFGKGLSLSTIGVLITAGTVALFMHYVFGFTLAEGALLGSVVSATDAAAVFSILRGKGVGLKGPLQPMLELESGSNDPMAYFLTITFTAIVAGESTSATNMLLAFVREFAIGGALGYAMGRVSVWIINRIRLGAEGLYPVLTLGLAMFTYSFTHYLGGNGFLAIYLCALIMGNSAMLHRRSLTRFYDGQAWLMQIILFLTLGLLVFPSRIYPIAAMGLAISAFLIFVARPLGVFGALAFANVNTRGKWFLSWVGLRGSVPIVFATYPLLAGIAKADLIFNLVFFISVTSVLLQGTTLSYVAKKLRVAVPESARRRIDPAFEAQDHIRGSMSEVLVVPGAPAIGKRIVQLRLPASVTILAVQRHGQYIAPNGSTLIQDGDQLTLLAENSDTISQLRDWHFGKARSPLPPA